MPDFSVYITVINKTGEVLKDLDTSAPYGHWNKVAGTIPAHSEDTLHLKDFTGPSGTEGTFTYNIYDQNGLKRSAMNAYHTDPWNGSNEIKPTAPDPKALYNLSFRARVADGPWKQDHVDPEGYPVHVEYTLAYQQKKYRFALKTITATSDHPVRNTKNQLVVGRHTLWSYESPSDYPDGERGSFQPNIFAYKFDSSVPEVSFLNVTVRPLDIELIGAECLLYGTVNGERILQSNHFFFKSLEDVTVQAHVVYPTRSGTPFAWNADVEWGMELALSKTGLECDGSRNTRLELYWIATATHRAFKQYIPVGFLRIVLQSLKTRSIITDGDEDHAHIEVNTAFFTTMTNRAWSNMNKIYDTILGASSFGMYAFGGIFNLDYYMASANFNGPPGTLFRFVNCMDQAAFVELSCSLMAPTSWLLQLPFGYINDTHLVGVVNNAGVLIDVNNPFFGINQMLAMVGQNSLFRKRFGLHVYIGESYPFVPVTDVIYDACSGPHLGTENIQQFVANSIDVNTTLYQHYGTQPGTVHNVVQGVGIIGINGIGINGWPIMYKQIEQARLSDISLPEALSQLTTNILATNVGDVTHVNWAHVPTWVQGVLGDNWDVRFGQVNVGETMAQAFWHLANTNAPGSPIRVHVRVVSVLDKDGSLDIKRSAATALEHVHGIQNSITRGDQLWASRILDGLGESALQYIDGVAAGRFVINARNVVMDIAGMSSTEELQPHAFKLLEYTMRQTYPPFTAPVHFKVEKTTGSAKYDPDMDTITVNGIDTRFSVVLTVGDKKIVTANAACEGSSVLFDRATTADIEGKNGSTVELLFVAREVGHNVISMYVADSETMVTGKKDFQVNVVEA